MLDSELDKQFYIGPLSCCVPKGPMYLPLIGMCTGI